MIRENGGKPAFPCNVCINEVAAHYTSPIDDRTSIPKGAIVKVDIGVHVDGYLADTAITICLNPEHAPLAETAELALKKACETIRHGIKASEVGAVIQKTIETYRFKPIWNLTGHKTVRYIVHSGKSIPNVSHLNGTKIEAGEVYAIEPFVTLKEADGKVSELNESFIYRYVKDRPLKNDSAKLLQKIKTEFHTLPFTKRWIHGLLPPRQFEEAFSELISRKTIANYPVLVEASGNPVAQAEHTVVVTKGGCTILTI